MNILIEGGNLNSIAEGTRNIALSYAKKFKERGHNVVVLTKQIDRIRNKRYGKFEIIDGIKFYRWFNYEDKLYNFLVERNGKVGRFLYKVCRIMSYWGFYRTYTKITKKEKIEVMNIFVKGFRPRVYLKFLDMFSNFPIIMTLLGDPEFNMRKYNLKKEFSNLDLIIIPSKTIYNHLKKFGVEGTRNIPYGIDTKKFKPIKKSNRKIKRIYCSRYYNHLPEVLRALEKVSKETEFELILEKKVRDDLKKYGFDEKFLGKIAKRVEYIGYLKDINKFLGEVDLVIDLHNEGKFLTCASPPAKILEAMATGKVVLSTNVSEISEFITDGKNGFLAEKNSSEEIYRKIKGAMESKRDIGRKARETILKNFDLNNSVIIYEKIYKELIKNENSDNT